MTIDKSLYELPKAKKNKKILLASESGAEEAELELGQLLKQFEEWTKENKGSWKDFLKSKEDSPVRPIKLNSGGPVTGNSLAEDYGELIDAWVKKIDVMENESLTDYINRIRAAEKND